MDINSLILASILLGLAGWIVHYIFIITAVFSKEKWLIWINYNLYREGTLEVILITIIIGFYIILIIIFFNN